MSTRNDDEAILHRLGYAQVLYREMGGFANFAISFTIISILAGCLTSYYIAFNYGGPVAITWGWLLVGAFCVLVAMAMGEIASAMPTAGALYFWASKLGGPSWGWFTGWFNLVGQIAVTAAIDLLAFGVLQALLRHDIRVPEDISLMGYDDIPFARQLSVPLSTDRRPPYGPRSDGQLLRNGAHTPGGELARLRSATNSVGNGEGDSATSRTSPRHGVDRRRANQLDAESQMPIARDARAGQVAPSGSPAIAVD